VSHQYISGCLRLSTKKAMRSLESGEVPLKNLAYTVQLHFDASERLEEKEVHHQPYQAAVQMMNRGKEMF
jgi:hypothetical protein